MARIPDSEIERLKREVSPAKNLWNCLGACGQGGSVIDWVMKRERVSFRHAVERLRGNLTTPERGSSCPSPPAEPEALSGGCMADVFYECVDGTTPAAPSL